MTSKLKSKKGIKDTNSIIEKRRESLRKYINMHKVSIDRTVFEKTNLEKQDLKIVKSRYKNR